MYVEAGPIARRPARNQRRSRLLEMLRRGNGANAQLRQEVNISPDILGDPSLLLPLIVVGFFAQLIDGALGMSSGSGLTGCHCCAPAGLFTSS